jgi:hypothetical protein
MRKRIVQTVALVAAAALSYAAIAQSSPTLTVAEAADAFRLSLPVSRLVMTIPKDGLTVVDERSQGGGTLSPTYFHLQDLARGIVVSGWFEPASAYAGFDAFWKGEAETLRRNGFSLENVAHAKVDKWDAALYDVEIPRAANTHIRAQWVEQGTWIDVHISVTTTNTIEAARETALEVLKGIRITVSQ